MPRSARPLVALVLALGGACAPATPHAPDAPPSPASASASASAPPSASASVTRAPVLLPEVVLDEDAEPDVTLDAAALGALATGPGIAKPGRECAVAPVAIAAPAPRCDDRASALDALDALVDPRAIELAALLARLAPLDACKGLEPGLVATIRADLAAPGCADAIAVRGLAAAPAKPVKLALVGLALAAIAERASTAAGLAPVAQAAASLPRGWGRSVALSGVASASRRVDPDGRDTVARARAAVQAMGEAGDVSARGAIARGMLAVPFGWLAELDAIRAFPPGPGPRGKSLPRPIIDGQPACRHCYDDRRRAAERPARFAEELAPFVSSRLLTPAELTSVDVLRAYANRRALPPRARTAIAEGTPSREALAFAAHARLAVALRTLDRRDVDRVVAWLSPSSLGEPTKSEALLLAIATSLREGPRDLDGWLASPPGLPRTARAPLEPLLASDDATTRALALLAWDVLASFDVSPLRGKLAPHEALLARLTAARNDDGIVRDRHAALAHTLELARARGERAEELHHLVGWPEVTTNGGLWSGETITAGNRAASVRTALVLASGDVGACLANAPPATAVTVRLSIERDGRVVAEPGGDEATACVARALPPTVTQPDFGPWRVVARFAR